MKSNSVIAALEAHRGEMTAVVPFDLTSGKVVVFDSPAINSRRVF